MTDFAKVLNPEQCAAATAAGGPLLVLAAAGTGKTRTLVHRVAYLVENGVPPERILLLTFTNRAAREMLERAEKLVPGVSGIWSGTFHHVCARFLRRYGSFLGYPPGFQILDEDDAKKLVGECIKEAGFNPKEFPKKEFVAKLISEAANREKDVLSLAETYQTKTALDPAAIAKVAEAYAARKKELASMDFDDLLVNGLRLLRENEGLRENLQEHFMHVLVDEYQDTNALQAEFTDILAAKSRDLMVVGDDFQCIYTWRGARFENIMQFPDRWPGCQIVKLERNYRSVKPVLDVANVVMRDVPHQFEKTLRPFRTGYAPKPELWRVWDSRAQADLVLRQVSQLRAEGYAWHDIAILYRSHFASIDVQMTLARARVPFRITSGVGVFEQLHVKDVLAYLRLCIDPKAELSFLRLVCLFPGVGEAGARKLWKKLGCAFDGTNPMDRMNFDSICPAKAKVAWEGVSKAFAQAADRLASGDDNMLVEDFVHFFYGDHLHREFETEADDRLADLGEITAQISETEGGLKGFLAEVALLTNLDARGRADVPEDHMTLSTIHQAKGMEWPAVVLPWLVEGIFPSSRAVEEGNTDEERRLFYVAVTRAKNRLVMITPRTRRMSDGGSFPVEPSPFVREIPRDLVVEDEVRFTPEDAYGSYGGYGGGRGGYGGGQPWRRRSGGDRPGSYTVWRR